jgi:hypothetical protein
VTLLVAFTVAFGAALLFVSEPAAGKTILPWLGGTPAAWGTTLLFFQLALILGYALVDQALRRGGARGVAVVHVIVLALAAIALGLAVPFAGAHAPETATVGRTLALLTIEIGVPIAALTLTAPALQTWATVVRGDRGASPDTRSTRRAIREVCWASSRIPSWSSPAFRSRCSGVSGAGGCGPWPDLSLCCGSVCGPRLKARA